MATTRATPLRPGTSERRGEDRRRAPTVRGRILVAGAVALSAVLLAAWFPFSSLLSQHRQMAAASEQLASLRSQDRALAAEQTKLSSPSEVAKLAREQYQLVQPGQRLVQVLPPSGSPGFAANGASPYPGDPGLAAPVQPSAVALLPSGTSESAVGQTSRVKRPTRAAPLAQPSGIVRRIVSSLEFWRR